MIDLSIVIVSYNTCGLLRYCLHSVFASIAVKPFAAEVWVVDNASVDGSPQMVCAEFPSVHLIINKYNRGFATACNQAIEQTTGRYVLLLNPDTVVLGETLGRMVEMMDSYPEAGAAGCRLLNPNGTIQHSCFRFPGLWMSFLDFFPINYRLLNSRLNGRYPWRCYEQLFPIDHPLGACLVVRRETIQQVGLLDEQFFMYCEEIDWCMRIKRGGWQIYYLPGTDIIHYGAQSTLQFRSQMFVELHKSRYRLFAKHYDRFFRWAVRGIVRLGVAKEALVAWWKAHRGQLSELELRDRLAAYGQVFRM
ncbi:MAG: glycosyltransferase family 2 protein [Chloroflexi bacterium]|nr:glycosyltransferase family 2 protein [Chloroflexota bacterium]MCL5075039.1 glycosyltransferase family 2 protein [Chloroflexota bacterium]